MQTNHLKKEYGKAAPSANRAREKEGKPTGDSD